MGHQLGNLLHSFFPSQILSPHCVRRSRACSNHTLIGKLPKALQPEVLGWVDVCVHVQAVIVFGVVLMFVSTIGGFRSLMVEAANFHFYKN